MRALPVSPWRKVKWQLGRMWPFHTHTRTSFSPAAAVSLVLAGLICSISTAQRAPSPHSAHLLLPLLLRPQLQAYLFHEPLPEICSYQFPSFLWSWSGPPQLACSSLSLTILVSWPSAFLGLWPHYSYLCLHGQMTFSSFSVCVKSSSTYMDTSFLECNCI